MSAPHPARRPGAHAAPQQVRLVDCPAQPWRNGGGLTRELLIWPPATEQPSEARRAADDWIVRVSVADIEQNGPFSSFPGIDRCFAVLQGAGVELGLPDGTRSVRQGDAPVAFPGEPTLSCQLIDGPTRDLNLMGRRSAGRIMMTRARPGDALDGSAAWRALFTFEPARINFNDGRGPQTLGAGTLAWSEQVAGPDGTSSLWQLEAASQAFWLTLHVHSAVPGHRKP